MPSGRMARLRMSRARALRLADDPNVAYTAPDREVRSAGYLDCSLRNLSTPLDDNQTPFPETISGPQSVRMKGMEAVIVRGAEVRKGLRLEYVNVAYNLLEAIVALVSGGAASSIALIGFGVDSSIETFSSAIMLWRLRQDDHPLRDTIERSALRYIGISFLLLAAYVAYESAESLWSREAPQRSIPGILLAIASLIVMPVMARMKRRVGMNLNSAAMVADSRQTQLCSWLSGILLGGLLLNAVAGWWWADPVAGLIMVPIIAREGIQALQGKSCNCGHGCAVG
ncbi:cation transporter [uncultured Paludibaculum sp.]|uniref:cation transporter n=1 Tax=uncultured Paludibaculum sp. TaxID=1765020 RepID=UPI002AAAB10E|nr:cation transporter [uncultured Paludibaculum sp.]